MSYQNRAYGYVYTDREEGYMPYEDINMIKRYNIDDRDMYLDRGNREVLKVLRDYILVPGDVLVIKNIQALGTNKKFIKEYLRYLYSNSIGVYFIENNELNVNLALEEKMSLIESTLIEIEREKKRQATIVGINRMPVNEYGVRYSIKTSNEIGRPVVQIPKNFGEIYKKWKDKELSSNEAIEQSGLKRTTFYNIVKAYEEFTNK